MWGPSVARSFFRLKYFVTVATSVDWFRGAFLPARWITIPIYSSQEPIRRFFVDAVAYADGTHQPPERPVSVCTGSQESPVVPPFNGAFPFHGICWNGTRRCVTGDGEGAAGNGSPFFIRRALQRRSTPRAESRLNRAAQWASLQRGIATASPPLAERRRSLRQIHIVRGRRSALAARRVSNAPRGGVG
jgi:hypothetical protein